jgi:RNA polymerase sigma-70 factor (ECF subfamily)
VLHAVHGLPYERIAEICRCQIGTVKSRINRARSQLKEMLLGEGRKAQALRAPAETRWRRPRRRPQAQSGQEPDGSVPNRSGMSLAA